jgi:hypothetical protein
MALATSVSGDGLLVSSEHREQDFYLTSQISSIHVRETTISTTREWVSLTKSAAETWLAGGTGVEYATGESRAIAEQTRAIHSYKATSTIETKTTEIIPPD